MNIITNGYEKGKLVDQTEFYASGKIYKKMEFKTNKLHGKYVTYYESGDLHENYEYEKGKLIFGYVYLASGEKWIEYTLKSGFTYELCEFDKFGKIIIKYELERYF